MILTNEKKKKKLLSLSLIMKSTSIFIFIIDTHQHSIFSKGIERYCLFFFIFIIFVTKNWSVNSASATHIFFTIILSQYFFALLLCISFPFLIFFLVLFFFYAPLHCSSLSIHRKRKSYFILILIFLSF